MSEPKRLMEESDSPLERAVLSAGSYSGGGDRLRVKVLVALGVATAVSTTSKTSLAMMASWKQAIVVGALGCVGAAGVVGYQQFVSEPELAAVAPGAGSKLGSEHAGSASSLDSHRQPATQTGAQVDPQPGTQLGAAVPRSPETTSAAEQPHPFQPQQAVEAQPGSDAAPSEPEQAGAESRRANTPSQRTLAAQRVKRGAQRATPRSAQAARDNRGDDDRNEPVARTEPTHGAQGSAPATLPSALEQEVAILDSARGALADGRWGDALRHLSDHAVRFPRGSLRLEAEVLRIEALASSGSTDEASRRARAILKRSPNSIVAARLRRFVRE
jgi:hypothetical protein